MVTAVCSECVEDEHLKKDILIEGEYLECSICNKKNIQVMTVESLGELLQPIMRENFCHGGQIKQFSDDDEWWGQEGESLSYWVQEVFGQYFPFEDEIVQAVIDAENVFPQRGEEAFFDDSCMYIESPVSLHSYYAEWEQLLDELKHKRRFFNVFAKEFFGKLFDEVEALKYIEEDGSVSGVVLEMPEKTTLYRARVLSSQANLSSTFNEPLKHVGPPPKALARAGRMNAEGVVVFYGALDINTCLAEMRPAIGAEATVIQVSTTKPLRLLDFTALEKAKIGAVLSYFQPDFIGQVEKKEFVRRLHSLISQPIIPSREPDYIITQTMIEYLAHVHPKPFDGILFASAQHASGINVVLFPSQDELAGALTEEFPLSYIEDSIKLYQTEAIEYSHSEKDVVIHDGNVYAYAQHDYNPDGD